MKISKSFFIFILVILLVMVNESSLFSQCAMCKAAAETSLKNDPSSMARSLNSGILYLLMMPYLLLAIVFRKQLYSLWKRIRNKEKTDAPIDQVAEKN